MLNGVFELTRLLLSVPMGQRSVRLAVLVTVRREPVEWFMVTLWSVTESALLIIAPASADIVELEMDILRIGISGSPLSHMALAAPVHDMPDIDMPSNTGVDSSTGSACCPAVLRP